MEILSKILSWECIIITQSCDFLGNYCFERVRYYLGSRALLDYLSRGDFGSLSPTVNATLHDFEISLDSLEFLEVL